MRPEVARPLLQRQDRHFVEVALGGEGVRDHPVGDLTAHLGHQLTDGGDEDFGVPYGCGSGVNIGVISRWV